MLLLFAALAAPAAQSAPPENFLVIVADDLGVDKVGAYAAGECARGICPSPPRTPTIDSLAAEGVLFRDAYANPVCSATRATALAGRYAFRTGIGHMLANQIISRVPYVGLDPSHPNLANTLRDAGYSTAAFGKWHVAGCDVTAPGCPGQALPVDRLHPIRSGFDYYAGWLGNMGGAHGYCGWTKIVAHRGAGGVPVLDSEARTTKYVTTDTTDEVVERLDGDGSADLPEPWLAWVAFHGVHNPLHQVPADPVDCEASKAGDPRELYARMTERLDSEIARILAAIPPDVRARTTVVFFGDNGTQSIALEPQFDPDHGKGTPYEGGTRVPFIVSSPRVIGAANLGRETAALVQATDLSATLFEIAARFQAAPPIAAAPADSISAVPALEDPAAAPRGFVWVERFDEPFATPPFDTYQIAVRDARHKLVLRHGEDLVIEPELYDLLEDPSEERNLYPVYEGDAHPAIRAVSRALRDEVAAIHGDYSLVLVTLGNAMAHDLDADGVCDGAVAVPGVCDAGPDVCPWLADPDQADADGDGLGDACNDRDDDGVVDTADNCIGDDVEPSSPEQCDTDGDGYGNLCDADFDGDGRVGLFDLLAMHAAYLSQAGSPSWNPDTDLDCDGRVGADDYQAFLRARLGTPGPSGLFCAGSPPCRDADGDAVEDGADVCRLVPDPGQCDTDGDGFGNACDGDLDGNLVVGFSDLALFAAAFGSRPGEPDWNPDADLDCDDDVDDADGSLFDANLEAHAPGPSGLACAGSPPCPAPADAQ